MTGMIYINAASSPTLGKLSPVTNGAPSYTDPLRGLHDEYPRGVHVFSRDKNLTAE